MPYWCSLAYLCNNIMNILNIMKKFKFTFVCKALAILASATSIAPLHAEPLVTLKQMVEKTISSNPEIQAKYHAYVGADTIVHLSSVGEYAAGFNAAKDVQTITLTGVDLVTGFANDQAIIANLITNQKLITD